MDARGVAAHGRRFRPQRPYLALRRPGRRARRHRTLPRRARQIPPRRSLGLRGYTAEPAWPRPRHRTYAAWRERGIARADGAAFARPDIRAKLTVPVEGGPAFLIGQNFSAVMSYNPAFSYALA